MSIGALETPSMAQQSITTQELSGMRVVAKNGMKRVGKVRSVVFHPQEKRVVGFIVKRPDLLWMFHRKDKFVSIEGYDMLDGRICIRNASNATDRAACKSLGISWDDCVIWVGMPLVTESGEQVGLVGDVTFNMLTGKVKSLETTSGLGSDALLGTKEIPVNMIKGFRRGIGSAIVQTEGADDAAEEGESLGAILVSNKVLQIESEGGLAEKAGAASAVVADKAGKAVKKTGEAVSSGIKAVGRRAEQTKEGFASFKEEYKKASGSGSKNKSSSKSKSATSRTASKKSADASVGEQLGKTVNKGARAVGKQLKKSKGMFAAFKEEYDKARHDG